MQKIPEYCFSGIHASTGRYLLDPCGTAELLYQKVCGDAAGSVQAEVVDSHVKRQEGVMRPPPWVDEHSLAEAGWGIVFPKNQDPAIKVALKPLLEWRQQQAGERYHELTYASPQTESQFLSRHGKGPGPVDPEILPYYLLLVGNPQQIPFDFQYQLDVEFAVGRLDLESTEDYERYAIAVVRSEERHHRLGRRAIFFGVSNPDDNPTAVSQAHLVEPLADDFGRRALSVGWELDRVYGSEATKSRLREILENPTTSASFLFTASHGVGFDWTDPVQCSRQGAILCADWPGPDKWTGGIPKEFYFSADDISEKVNVAGSIIMSFACYSGGTPQRDSFYHREGRDSRIAASDFVARLPQRLLARGALAFVGHVDRAWTFSFYWPEAKSQRGVFESTLVGLLQGRPIGAAMDYFSARHAKLATDLIQQQIRRRRDSGATPEPLSRSGLWTAYYDAKSYVILGDPAVRFQ